MRYLAVFVAIGLSAADDGPCFSHVAVSDLLTLKLISSKSPTVDDTVVKTCTGQL